MTNIGTMELRHLQAFVRLTETLNFSSAANDLCITQSTLSATIRQLEDSLGAELFIRNSHGVAITEAGEQLLPIALETLHQAENCVSRIQDLNNLKCGKLRVGLSHSFTRLMVSALREFNRRYPGVDVQMYYKTLPELMELLISHDLDLVLSYKPSVPYPQIESPGFAFACGLQGQSACEPQICGAGGPEKIQACASGFRYASQDTSGQAVQGKGFPTQTFCGVQSDYTSAYVAPTQ